MRLNDPILREKYETFPSNGTAPNTEEMPRLIADNRDPISPAQIMKRRLELRNSDYAEVKENWMYSDFDTGDGALCVPDGSLVVAYDAQALREMTPESKLVGGALDLGDLDLKDVDGTKFTKAQLERMVLGTGLTLEQAKSHPIWEALARDKTLASDYAEMVFKDHGHDIAMGVSLDQPSDNPKMKAWYVGGVGDESEADGNDDLNYDICRLVGVASEMQDN